MTRWDCTVHATDHWLHPGRMPSAPPPSVPAFPTLYALALALRVLNACLTRTSFQPDEYYQTLEVAHRIAFGYGYETWEWRGDGIRSVLYPGLFVPLYWALGKLGLDGGELTVRIFASVGIA